MSKSSKLLSPYFAREEAQKRLDELMVCKAHLQEALDKAPKGRIHIVNGKNKLSLYLRLNPSDKTGKYLSVNEKDKIRSYTQKSYDEQALAIIKKEIHMLEDFLNNSIETQNIVRELYNSYHPKLQKVLSPVDLPDDEYIRRWEAIEYERKPILTKDTEQITNKGEQVRSKSEINIANALFKAGIPYKYECPLPLKGCGVIHPDFTVLDVRRRKVVYWEHRGMMDSQDYARNSVARIRDYQKNGIYLGDNLIITEETSTNQLGTVEIKRIIDHYFC